MLKTALAAMALGATVLAGCSIRTQVPQIASAYNVPAYDAPNYYAASEFGADPTYARPAPPPVVAIPGATRGEAADKGEGGVAALPAAKAKVPAVVADVPKIAADLPPAAPAQPAPVKRPAPPAIHANPPPPPNGMPNGPASTDTAGH
jgi:hypothetical protein